MEHFNNIDWHATDRCNLRCVACGHMCALVDYQNKSVDRTPEQAEADLSLLYKLTNNGEYVDNISITGGECTLNTKLPEILDVAYKYFPNKIMIWSNAINLNLYTEELINKIKEYNIKLQITLYNLNNESRINDFFNSHNISYNIYYKIFDDTNELKFFSKFFTVKPIENNNDTTWCGSKLNCCQLKDQKLYVCQYLGYLNYLFDYFGEEYADKLEYNTSSQYLDLTTVTDYAEIYDYVVNYNENICKHCVDKWAYDDFANKIQTRLVKWHISKQDIKEWICESIDEINSKN